MEDAGIQREIHRRAKEMGHEPATMSHAVYVRIVKNIYADKNKLIHAGVEVTKATIRSIIKGVSNDVAQENNRSCENCIHSMFKILKKGTREIPACEACGCSGRTLQVKWKDGKAFCPLTVSGKRCDIFGDNSPDDPDDPPTWDNRGKSMRIQIQNTIDDAAGIS